MNFKNLILIIFCLMISFQSLFAADATPANPYDKIRNMLLTVTPQKLHLTPSVGSPVWGIVMEGTGDGTAYTLFVLAEGTISLYLQKGGAVIGAGQQEGPKKVGKEFLDLSQGYLGQASQTQSQALPQKEHTHFYFLTFNGTYLVDGKDQDFLKNKHPLSPLFQKGHVLFSEIRTLSDKGVGKKTVFKGK